MQVCRRQLEPRETDHELVWLAVSVGSLILAAAWLTLGLPWPRCMFHEITGLPCITCGMTRCGIQFFHGHFLAALKWNPLVFALLCGVMAYDLYAFTTLSTRAPRLRVAFGHAQKRWTRGIVIGALLLNWGYLLIHWHNF